MEITAKHSYSRVEDLIQNLSNIDSLSIRKMIYTVDTAVKIVELLNFAYNQCAMQYVVYKGKSYYPKLLHGKQETMSVGLEMIPMIPTSSVKDTSAVLTMRVVGMNISNN